MPRLDPEFDPDLRSDPDIPRSYPKFDPDPRSDPYDPRSDPKFDPDPRLDPETLARILTFLAQIPNLILTLARILAYLGLLWPLT